MRKLSLQNSIQLLILNFILLFSVHFDALAQIDTQKKPNIVLIFMDDMGYGDLNSFGSVGYNTDNLDQLAAGGMRFTNFYAAQPVCSASRAGILTGCYPNRVGITGALFPNSAIGLANSELTIPEMLKKKGYATAMVGKWHLGDSKKFLPLQHGFDEFLGLPYSNDMWPLDYDGKLPTNPTGWKAKMPQLPLIEDNERIQYIKNIDDQDEITTRYTEKAVSFINKNKNKPFFLYFAHSMPHVPLAVSSKFKGKSEQGMYGDVMMEIDWSVGQIMNSLKENGLDKNTLVIFTSDNGPWLNFGNHAGSSGGLNEGKHTSWEGGQRVPAIMKWPAVIPKGVVNHKLASTIDLLPTIAAITGSELPKLKIDGVNILSLLKAEAIASPRESLYYYANKNSLHAVRKGNWKLVLPHEFQTYKKDLPGMNGLRGKRQKDSTAIKLFDLRRDPGERYNVYDQNPDVVKELMELVDVARLDLGDDLTNVEGKNKRAPGNLN